MMECSVNSQEGGLEEKGDDVVVVSVNSLEGTMEFWSLNGQ